MRTVSIEHLPTGTLIAEGPLGWGITPFEGNYYISRRYLRQGAFRSTWVPGLCVYKFLYVWLDFLPPVGEPSRFLAWCYWLPNPLLAFIAFRVALPGDHPELCIRVTQSNPAQGRPPASVEQVPEPGDAT